MGRLSSFAITLSIVLWLCLNSCTFGSDPMAVRIDDGLARYRNEISKNTVACMSASKFPSVAPGTIVVNGPLTTLQMQDTLVVSEERLCLLPLARDEEGRSCSEIIINSVLRTF